MLLKYEAQSKKLGFFVFFVAKSGFLLQKCVFLCNRVATINIFCTFLHFFAPTPCTFKIKFIPLYYQMQKITHKRKKVFKKVYFFVQFATFCIRYRIISHFYNNLI